MRKTYLNKLIDAILHPYFKKHPELIILNGILHTLIEQNPKQSLKKFIKYNYHHLQKYNKT
ncbi:hypothetical protein CW703_02095 [Candidatus Bathyarchaeota archaeon]|nr:MAG: hypothetical protein CW703_02095 [Candidatus Bathyarchaeota archaeon]